MQSMLTFKEIKEARERIALNIIKTPLLRVEQLDDILGCEVYIKPESLQKTGSFKIRGATNRILLLTEEEKKNGVIASSSGNHAQGVACAAQKLSIDAKIVMPKNCNPLKLEGVKKYGATVLLEGVLASDRDSIARELAKKEGRVEIHPFADRHVAAGQGTVALEILEDNPDIDVIITPVGGGGLLSGVAVAAKAIKPSITIVGAEPTGAARYTRSRELGHPASLSSVDTIADGTRTNNAHENNFTTIEKYVDKLFTVDDEYLIEAMRLLLLKAKLLIEPSGALPIGIVLNKAYKPSPQQKVCFVLSGGNCDTNVLKDIL